MAYLRPSTIQYKDHIIHVRWEDGMPYLNVQDVEQALGLPPGSYHAWLASAEGRAALQDTRRHLGQSDVVMDFNHGQPGEAPA